MLNNSDINSTSASGDSPSQQPSNTQAPIQPQVSNPQTVVNNPASTPQAPTVQQQNPQTVSNTPAQPSQSPHASLFHSIFESLAGGPNRRLEIRPDGSRVVTEAPKTRSQIGAGIVAGALAGMFGGAGEKGPGSEVRSFANGGQAVIQQNQQRNQEQDAQAQQQFVNRAAAISSNLRTRAMAQEIGMREEKAHQDWIASHASTADAIRAKYPSSVVMDMVPESEVNKPEFIKQATEKGWVGIPVKYVPRFDANGNHYSQDGTPMHDMLIFGG